MKIFALGYKRMIAAYFAGILFYCGFVLFFIRFVGMLRERERKLVEKPSAKIYVLKTDRPGWSGPPRKKTTLSQLVH